MGAPDVTTLRDTLATELELECPLFRRSLERVPLARRGWKPHEKSMTLGWLSTFLAVMWSWGVTAIEEDSFDLQLRAGAGRKPPEPTTTKELLQLFDDNVGAYGRALSLTTDDHLRRPWQLLSGGQLSFEQPRWLVLRTFVMNHAVHHRAQLGVYLRLNGVTVPAIYNDSADERGGLFR